MSSLRTVWTRQSFPSADDRISWILTVLSLLVALLLTVGLLRIEIGRLPPASWLAIICAQILTAIVVTAAASRSRHPEERPQDPGSDLG